ncbi:hypothetical protein LZ31DRAFT_595780 [Colletotrichum somersetense]|nr:hypothetical protein LZ31DRAFT_595780 [Colletotrichum somersetense]
MPSDPQTQSNSISRLPREVRDTVYLQLWRSCGLRQHILWHGAATDQHFCHWSCNTEYRVEDELQRGVEKMRAELGVPLGQEIMRDRHNNAPLYYRRLQSPWINHWICGERSFEEHDVLWPLRPPPGHEDVKNRGNAPSFLQACPALLMCANHDLPRIPRRQDVYAFHWLQLGQFQNLQSVHIWIAARSVTCGIEAGGNLRGIKQFNADALKDLLTAFGTVGSVTLSTPLSQSLSPEEGYMSVGAVPIVRLYKRGSGDRFHPFLSLIELGCVSDRLIYTRSTE